ncbi:uncharacterized protein LOC102804733 [Saccoglossus kowalevskii]|uniref:Uncharacterized protein LOC102804733 n=1 Tax=Saccoglossus kowalevskii TaxID=10224 RepID=A0ABM0M3L6_SACKO|nr:PREDICTED: uncharacterized protein LOC102804733 [Saccoglossus kowalevskii]
MLHAVHELLEEAQKEHISRFLLREKNSKQNVIVKCNLTEIQKQIDDELMMVYRGQPGCLLLAKELFSTELDLASQTAVVDHLESVCAELETTAKENEEANRMLLQKSLKIQNFTVVVETNQNIIQLLLRQNNDSRRKLEEEQHQLHQYIQNNLCSQEVGTVALATQLKDGVKSEVDKFCSLSLPYLMLTTMDDTELIAVRNLSINRLHNTSLDSGGQTIQHVLNTLKFPLYKDAASTGALTEKIKIHDREHKRRVLPILKQRLSETTPAKERLSKIKKLESVWWDQPAQNLVTWMRVDDMTMDEVKNTWRVETTKLIQS